MSNKRDCDIAQDLIPLEIDGICTEGSRDFLNEHMQECESCRRLHEAMTRSSSWKQPKEDREEIALRHSMKRARIKMLAIRLVLIPVIFIALLYAVVIGYSHWGMYQNHLALMPLSNYTASVIQYKDRPQVIATVEHDAMFVTDTNEHIMMTGQGAIITYSINYYDTQAKKATADSQAEELLVQPLYDPAGPNRYGRDRFLTIEDGLLYVTDESSLDPVLEVRVTDGRSTQIIYAQGDTISESIVSLANAPEDAQPYATAEAILPTPTPEAE